MTPVAGQQFEYSFDDIGNRTSAKAGGDQNGGNLRAASYLANPLNQYTNRTVPSAVDVIGLELAANTVFVNGQTTYRHGEYFRKELAATNTSAPQWLPVCITATNETTVSGNIFVPQTPEQFTYDLDGNLLSDGRWSYTWDAENQLVKMVTWGSPAPAQYILFEYDRRGRRVRKQVWNNPDGLGPPALDMAFVYDGWNLVAELQMPYPPYLRDLVRSYMWGLDLSGSLQGAGGIGGLLQVTFYGSATTNCFVAFDGGGNVVGLISATDGTILARYDQAPFGEPLRLTGQIAKMNPLRFSTKFKNWGHI
jgi:hypothetical protein